MKTQKSRLRIIGIIAVSSPLPMIIITILWFFILFFGVGMGILGYASTPDWILYVGLLPLLFSPAFDIFGIVYGIIKRKERHSVLCIILSAIGLLINFALLFGMIYLGSRF
ncbi:MAG: hypothetical protein IJC83_04390 [Oscillospiraceae bacterium]|nr:hypothetical protein [Oscillospiraceae bacterium]